MAEANTWDSICRHGLLSTTALLDLFEIRGPKRMKIESCRRPDSIEILHPEHGAAIIRDQKPLSEKKLTSCLVGMTPTEWYELLNRKVFFWPTEERIQGLLTARAYRGSPHTVITVDSKLLLESAFDRTFLSPINSGAVIYRPTPRGRFTFCSITNWPDDLKRSGIPKKPVSEVSVDYSIPDIIDITIHVEERQGDRIVRTIF